MNHYRWHVLPPAPAKYLSSNADFPPLIAQLLYNRGLNEPAQIAAFTATDENQLGDPFLLPDMHQAVTRIYRALLSGENIAIYGDYDADGITATALLVKGLTYLGGNVIPYIPHRIDEGYGLRTHALEKLYHDGISLVITVDCGITAVTQIKKARRIGLDIIVTDHHTPLPELPEAVALVCPKLPGSDYPFSELTGVGVAFKLIQALLRTLGKDNQLDGLIDLVTIGTIADIAPVLGENRYLIKRGLEIINQNPRLGLREMIARTSLSPGSLDAASISWVLAPRLNAAGRLAHAMISYNLLMTDSPEEAEEIAMLLEQKNSERQRLTEKAMSKAKEQVSTQLTQPILIAADRDYPAGIMGLVAGRLSEAHYRPVIVISTGEQMSSGSCRSIPEFNIILALNQCHKLLKEFGGHSQAAGFTLPTKNLPRFKAALLNAVEAELSGVDLQPSLTIDTEIALPDLAGDTIRSIYRLAPFGQGNPQPAFLSRAVEVIQCSPMGNNGGHIRLKLRQGNTMWQAVGFGLGSFRSEVSSHLDIVYNLEKDRWRGEERLRLNILDFMPATQDGR